MMRKKKGMSRLRLFSILGSILFAWWFLYYFVSPLGYLAVKSACDKEGGLRVGERIKSDGYLHSGYDWRVGKSSPDCRHCAEHVALRNFAFVDFELPKREAGESDRFVQYRLMPDTNDKCVAGASFTKPPVGMCIAILPLDRKPNDKYQYRSELLTTKWFGVELRERHRTLIDASLGRVISQERYFSFRTPYERARTFGPSYHCEHSNHNPLVESAFFSAAFDLAGLSNTNY